MIQTIPLSPGNGKTIFRRNYNGKKNENHGW